MLEDSQFRKLLDAVQEGIYFVDCDRRILYWNGAAERITGFAGPEVVERHCFNNILAHVDDAGTPLCQGRCPLAATLSDGQDRRARVFLRHKEGHRLAVQVITSPVIEGDRIVGAVESFHDDSCAIAAQEELQTLRQTALVCPVTGLANRAHTEQVIEERLQELKRGVSQFGLFFVDVDHFKAVNDRYGHACGDATLRMVGRSLFSALRTYDFLGRWGGEEFIVVLPGIRAQQLDLIGERLRVLVEASGGAEGADAARVTVSCGGCMARPSDTMETLVARADRLMYESKSRGRNRVTLEGEETWEGHAERTGKAAMG